MTFMLRVERHFSQTPGGRRREEGPNSGQAFLEVCLLPALQKYPHVTVDLDGTYGYSTGFLEESFGGLARELGASEVRKRVALKSEEEPHLVQEVWGYVDAVKST